VHIFFAVYVEICIPGGKVALCYSHIKPIRIILSLGIIKIQTKEKKKTAGRFTAYSQKADCKFTRRTQSAVTVCGCKTFPPCNVTSFEIIIEKVPPDGKNAEALDIKRTSSSGSRPVNSLTFSKPADSK
jgi:hypothetical protein